MKKPHFALCAALAPTVAFACGAAFAQSPTARKEDSTSLVGCWKKSWPEIGVSNRLTIKADSAGLVVRFQYSGPNGIFDTPGIRKKNGPSFTIYIKDTGKPYIENLHREGPNVVAVVHSITGTSSRETYTPC